MVYRKANKPITRKPSANRAKPKSKPKSKPKVGRGEMATVYSRKRAGKSPVGKARVGKAKPARKGPVKGTGKTKRR